MTNKTTRHVLVTGGGGYVGAVLVPKLLDHGYHVTVLDWFLYGDHVFGSYRDHERLTVIRGDIRNANTVKSSLQGINSVIHLACISNDPSFELDPNLGKAVNYDATQLIIDESKRAGVTRFIYASSSSVYGVKQEENVTEDLPLEPLTDYSKYKMLGEEYLLSTKSPDFTVLILRPATVCGYSPRMRLDLTVNILTIQALVNKKITVYGGNQKRPNIHIEDMTDLYVFSLEYDTTRINGSIFNAGYENYTVLQTAQMVRRVIGDSSIEIVVQESADTRSYHICSDKIRRVLGFIPKHGVEEAIRDIQTAYTAGKLPDPMTHAAYYNIRMMKQHPELSV